MRDRIIELRDRFPRVAIGPAAAQWAEAILILLLIVQAARLFWSVVTPVGMYGEWRERSPALLPPAAQQALFTAFDPFFRTEQAAGGGQVTGLALQLFGIRINEGSGQGSAIIATPDGVQASYAVGDEIMPGVVLKQVVYDHVVIERGSVQENLYIDQSSAASPDEAQEGGDGEGAPEGAGAPAAGAGSLTAEMIQQGIAFSPRTENGRVTGIVASPTGDEEAFSMAGLRPGDIITQVNGQPVTSAGDLQRLAAQVRPGARLSLMVERGAATVPIAVVLSGGR